MNFYQFILAVVDRVLAAVGAMDFFEAAVIFSSVSFTLTHFFKYLAYTIRGAPPMCECCCDFEDEDDN